MRPTEHKQYITLSAILALAVAIAFGAFASIPIAIWGFLLVVAIAISYKYPRLGLWIFLIYLPFSGTVTYAIAQGSPLYLGLKDAFYFPALIALIQEYRQGQQPWRIPPLLRLALGLVLLSILLTLVFANLPQAFVSGAGESPFLMGVMGLKILIGYIPLMFCSYYLMRQTQDVFAIARLFVVLALICCLLGFLQYGLLSSGVCAGTRGLEGQDLFRATLEARCLVGGSLVFSPEVNLIRLPGTFVSPWQWSWFLIANGVFSFTAALSDPSRVWKRVSLGATIAIFLMAVFSGHRLPVLLLPTFFLILLLLALLVERRCFFQSWREKSGQLALVGVVVAIAIAAIVYPPAIPPGWDATRWEAAPPLLEFIGEQFQFAINSLNGVFGNGLGRATNAARMFGTTTLIESYYPKLLYELGFPGLLSVLALVSAVSFLTFKAYRGAIAPHLRLWGLGIWLFIVSISYNSFYYPLDVAPVAVYYWWFAGMALKLPQLNQGEG